MGKVQEKGYQSSFPIMYNINGIATYVMSLKDQAGLIKMVAMVSVQDYSIVGVGDNLKDALRSYKDAYNNSGNKNPIVHDAKLAQKAAGKVLRISEDVSGGNSYYYMIIDNQADKIFIGNSNISRKLPLTSVGDSISINFEERQGEEVEMLEFENYNIKTAVKPKEEKKDN